MINNYSHVKDLIAKNTIIMISWILLYRVTENSFSVIESRETLGTVLLFVGLIIVAPLFAKFAYTYKETPKKKSDVLLGHMVTGLLMWTIGVLLIMTDVLFLRLVGNIPVFRAVIFAIMTAVILFDFWDYRRRLAAGG